MKVDKMKPVITFSEDLTEENELEEMTRLFGGETIDLGKGGAFGMINPLEVNMDVDEEEVAQGLGYTVLTRTLQSLKALFSILVTESEITISFKLLQL